MRPLLTIADLMERLKVSRSTLQKMRARPEVKFPKPLRCPPGTRLVRWDPDHIDAWEKRHGLGGEAR